MLLITCPYGLSTLLSNELKRLGYAPQDSFDTGTYVDATLSESYNINLHSRIANKVFLRLNVPNICTNFDDLFDMVSSLDRASYIGAGQGISIKAHLRQSNIDSATSCQSIVHKAICTKLTGSKDAHRDIDKEKPSHSIYIMINKNIVSVFINTSGLSLHKRGYTQAQVDAPLKENIAAGLIYLANRNYKDPLIDPCCGSGTICIEAAMIAKNIAPGLDRYFAFEDFPCYDKKAFETLRDAAEEAIFKEKSYSISGSDINPEVIEIAKANAKHAGVDDTIAFSALDISEGLESVDLKTTIVCNPPYGIRLQQDDLQDIHETLASSMTKKSIIITGYAGAKKIFPYSGRSTKNVKNGAEEVKIYLSK